MTITTSSSKTVVQGNGVTTVFAFNFLIPAPGQELVIFTDVNGNQTTLTNTQYSLSGFGVSTGGTVTYPTIGSPIAAGTTLTIARILPLVQNTSISNQGAFYPNAVEAALDYLTMEVQQISQGQSQAVIAPIVDAVQMNPIPAAAQRANMLLGFDSTGQPIAAQPSSALVSTPMQPIVSAASVAAAVGLLGIPTFVGVGITSGSANAQIVSATTPGTFALTSGNKVVFIPQFGNTGAMTLQVGTTAQKNFYVPSSTGPVAMSGGELVANQITGAIFDGTQFVLETNNPNATFGTMTNLASGGTTNLGSVGSHNVNITGTTTITSFGTGASISFPVYLLTFAGALTLTYNATSMILPGGSNIVTVAGDTAVAQYLGSGNWKIVSYTRSAASAPVITALTSGSGTYTTPTGALYLRGRMVGGGGGGGAQSTNAGSVGTDTSFGAWTAIHGSGGAVNGGAGGAGGTGGVNGTGTVIRRLDGAAGQGAPGNTLNSPSTSISGGMGGGSPFGGAGAAVNTSAGGAAKANTGSGGAGGGASTGSNPGGGGGAGEFVEFLITSPSATYSYTVGTGGAGGAAGGNAGGNGAAGRIEVEAYFQ